MIYFKGGDKAKNLKELLNLGFSCFAGYGCRPDFAKFTTTYYDKGCTGIYQSTVARRSFQDLLEIAKTYFPKTTEEQLAYHLFFRIKNIHVRYCCTINRVVFYIKSSSSIWEDDEPMWKEDPTGISFDKVKQLA